MTKKSNEEEGIDERFKQHFPRYELAIKMAQTTLGMSAVMALFIGKKFSLNPYDLPLDVMYAIGSTAVHMCALQGQEKELPPHYKDLSQIEDIQEKIDIVTDALIAIREDRKKDVR